MLQVHIIPAFTDNYFWLIQPNSQSPQAYIIDPGAAEPVKAKITELGLTLAGILITHHHHDHIDGVDQLSKEFNLPVYGPKSPRIPQITHYLGEGDTLDLDGVILNVLALPGHTLDHIGYYISRKDTPPLLFCGDTLFAGGCGRLFDGTAELLYQSLMRIAALPDDTIIYCAHEYTVANLKFAQYIEPSNTGISARYTAETSKRAEGLPTIPTQLSLEKRTNPFLRCHLPQVRERVEAISALNMTTTTEIFANLRRAKDRY